MNDERSHQIRWSPGIGWEVVGERITLGWLPIVPESTYQQVLDQINEATAILGRAGAGGAAAGLVPAIHNLVARADSADEAIRELVDHLEARGFMACPKSEAARQALSKPTTQPEED